MNFDLDLQRLVLIGLVTTRTLTFMMSMPILGVKTVPRPVRIGLGLWMGLALVEPLVAVGVVVPMDPAGLAFAIAIEVLMGLVLAFGVVLVFATVQFAGQIIGIQIGFSLANVIDPQSESQVSVVSQLYNLLAALVFLAVDGPLIVLRALDESFRVLAPGSFTPAPEGMMQAVSGFGVMFSLALRIALPVIVTLLLISVSMGLLGRTVPQLNILVLGFPLKILVGTAVLAASIPLFSDVLTETFGQMPDELFRIVHATAMGR